MNTRMDRNPFAELHARANDSHCTVTDKARTVSLTVGQIGELMDIRINPAAYQKLTAVELEDTIVRLYSTATDQLLDKLSGEFEKTYGFAWTLKDILNGSLTSRTLADKITAHVTPSMDPTNPHQ